jgi:UDP-N-acetylglucosamine--N-acetylmuramyl-(pentapeptide) pyrophosphoryl-undecaprenol N-acetylglucosamine transferase
MKIVLIGGHLSPALSLIEHLKKDEVLYIGRKHAMEGDASTSLEYQTLKKMGINFEMLNTGRLQRKLTIYTIPSLLKIPLGFFQSISILKKFKPDIVVGFGGYLSVPVIIASYFLKIPTVIHEQTLEAGFANKFLARFVDKICVSWQSSFKYFPKAKTVLTGNPIRKEIREAKRERKDDKTVIYVTGGSLGSHKMNKLIEENINDILRIASVIHQTGDSKIFNDYERLQVLKEGLGTDLKDNYKIFKFIEPDNVGEVMINSDLVISRSGINTVSELIYLNKPSLFIPLSFSQRQEQLKNAQMAKELGIAEVFLEDGGSKDFLILLKKMIENLKSYSNEKNEIFHEDASENILKVINKITKSG